MSDTQHPVRRICFRSALLACLALFTAILFLLWIASERRLYILHVGTESVSLHIHIACGLIMPVVFYPQSIPRPGFWITSEKYAPSYTDDVVGDTTEILQNDRHTFGSFGFGQRDEWGETFSGIWMPFWFVIILCILAIMKLWSNKSPEPTAVGAVSSAVAVHVASRRWLSFFR